MSLQADIESSFSNRTCYFTNASAIVGRLWPMIQVTLLQTNGLPLQTYELRLNAAPLEELWFSVGSGFHAGIWNPPTNYVGPGDLISTAGRVVKRNQELTARLGIMPVVPELGLDALDIQPGGDVVFSMEQDVFSETLGPLHHGDVLSQAGRVVSRYQDLIGIFGPEPPVADEGLDALQVLPDKDIYFSVARDFFSENLGRVIGRGDLLSSQGRVVLTNQELVGRFAPAETKPDYGLDALYVWPSQEIWFSTETGFYGSHFEFYSPGDLLSNQGYVVGRNLDLLTVFQPVEDVSNFGLDALFVVTGAIPVAPDLEFTRITPDYMNGHIFLEWRGGGRIFRVERAERVEGPYLPRSPILPDLTYGDLGVLNGQPQAYYRIKQW